MIVPDTAAWVEFFRATESTADRTLTRLIIEKAPLATTEIVVLEVLAGVGSVGERRAVRTQLLGLPVLALQGVTDYERAADLYRAMRRRGVTVRKLTDVLIGLCALDAGASVLHDDRDFDAMASVIDLAVHPHDG
ncbi:MAG: type II toxin-antitoxin system VapC family toxin [Pseudonocardia sp.]